MTDDRGIILHVSGSEEAQLHAGITSARNVRAQLPDIIMEIVVQGPAVAFLRADSELRDELATLGDGAIVVLACGNSLRSIGIEPDGLLRGVSVVPAAVVHLATRQLEGWAYIRV